MDLKARQSHSSLLSPYELAFDTTLKGQKVDLADNKGTQTFYSGSSKFS